MKESEIYIHACMWDGRRRKKDIWYR